jgi:gluconate 2-dehydrogenase gamma chain
LPISRREFIKVGAVAAIGAGVASAIEIPILQNSINNDDAKIKQLQNQIDSQQAFITLGVNEQKIVEAAVETIIPSDQNGPGAKEAGVIFFIDHQLALEYGNNARMYMSGPFVPSGKAGPITVGGITYSQGSPSVPFTGPTYQYSVTLREFWRAGLLALQDYSNKSQGKNFENLTIDQRTQVLTDLYNNTPASFNNIVSKDFFNELIFMTYAGFTMDPAYGGNANKVGWQLTGFTGANMGDSFNEGRDVMALMVANKPTRLAPHSMGEFQRATGGIM